jgi:hypothetical protein
MAMLPSPTAAATRLTGLNRTSPLANMPGTLVSRRYGSRSSCQSPAARTSGPVTATVDQAGLADPHSQRPPAATSLPPAVNGSRRKPGRPGPMSPATSLGDCRATGPTLPNTRIRPTQWSQPRRTRRRVTPNKPLNHAKLRAHDGGVGFEPTNDLDGHSRFSRPDLCSENARTGLLAAPWRSLRLRVGGSGVP